MIRHQETAKKIRLRKNTETHFCFLFWGLHPRHQALPQGSSLVQEADVTSVLGSWLLACTVLGRGVPGAHLAFGGFSVEFPRVFSHGLLLLQAEPALQAAQASCP